MKKYLLLLLVLLFTAGCATPMQPTAVPGTPQPTAVPGLPRPAHVVIVIEENKSYNDIIGSSDAPYINELMRMGASLNSFYAFHHPSQPNYFELYAGTHVLTIPQLNQLADPQYPVLDDLCVPFPGTATTPNLGTLLGEYFLGYAENWDLTKPFECSKPPDTIPPGYTYYAQKHAPWTVFNNWASTSRSFNKDFPTTPDGFEQLPWVSIVIPDLIDDMHTQACDPAETCGAGEGKDIHKLVKQGDQWLEEKLDAYVQWAMKNDSLLIVTFDENSRGMEEGHDYGYGYSWPQNQIPTILVGEMVKPGSSSNVVYNHHDLLRTIEDMYQLTDYLGGSANAQVIMGIWK